MIAPIFDEAETVASEFEVVRGATFQLGMAVQNDDGTPLAGANALTITSGLRTPGNALVTTLTIIPTGTPALFAIQAATDTWPLGRLFGDIRISDGTVVLYTDSFAVTVLQNMTPAA